MHVLGFIRKEIAKKVLNRDVKLRKAKKDREIASTLRNQANVIFLVRIQGKEKPWNSERLPSKPLEVAQHGPMKHVVEYAVTEFRKQNKNEPTPTCEMVTVEAVLPNQTKVSVPEAYWKKYL